MWELAIATVRARKAAFVGVFVAVACAAALITALGVLLESGLRSGVAPERYAAAAVVVGGQQAIPVAEDVDPHFTERVPVPASVIGALAGVSGVDRSIGDMSVPVTVNGIAAIGHGWGSAPLTPLTIRDGAEPAGRDQLVLDAGLAERLHVRPGDRVTVAVGAVPAGYTVSGVTAQRLARQPAVMFPDDTVKALSGKDSVDTVGVIAKPGTDPGELAARIRAAVPGLPTYTGTDRGDVEFLDVGAARTQLVVLSLAFAGTAIMIAMLVVVSTLTLSIQQRRRELALLRAIAATRRQIHRLVGAETLVVAGTAAVAGALPGYGLAALLRAGFAKGGVLPADFGLALSPVPALAAILLCVLAARVAGWVAARRPARISPVEALGESTVEDRPLPRLRVLGGTVAGLLGVAASGLPLLIPGEAAVAGAAGSALLLVLSVALLGPRLVTGAVRVLGAPLRRLAPVGGYLATANTLANSRRLAAAVTPLVLAVTMASVQIFSQTTLAAAAAEQARDGVTADFVVAGQSGLGPGVVEAVRALPGVTVAAPVARSQVFVSYLEAGQPKVKPYAAQGVQPGGVLELRTASGTLDGLRGETVALSRIAADTFGVKVGGTVDLALGDGTRIRPTVVATYGRGLGFGDVTLPHDLLLAHTTSRLDQSVLVRGGSRAALAEMAGRFPGVVVLDGLSAAGQAERDAQDWPNLIALAVILAYLAIAVVNTLVMATAARGREFALLRLVGTGRRQVLRMMRLEALIVVGVAAVVGTLAAVPPLVGIGLAMTDSPVPAAPLPVYAGIVGVTALLGWLAIGVPARFALRSRPVEVISGA